MDVFWYLLNPLHFDVTENALLEAMAAGLPVVAMENYMMLQTSSSRKTIRLLPSYCVTKEDIDFLY